MIISMKRVMSLIFAVGAVTAGCQSGSSTPGDASVDQRSDGGDHGSSGGQGGTGGGATGGGGGAGPGTGGVGGGGVQPGLDACFAGLRAGQGAYQVATKASADKSYRMRLALETADRLGTSGTKAWRAFRFGLETPTGNVCITDEQALLDAYQVTHHNCADVMTVAVKSVRYVIEQPDTMVDYENPTIWTRPGTLKVFVDDQMVGNSIHLETVSCDRTADAEGRCYSGGPC
jgi:hypothetical protein